MIITRVSPIDKMEYNMDINVTIDQMNEFLSDTRRNIQDIFPNITPDEREFIKTGITPKQWEDLFGNDDDDDDLSEDFNPFANVKPF